jgi:hypothetical protein
MPISETLQLGFFGAGTVIVALLACENKIDNDKLEKAIVEMFDEQIDVEVKSVDCPEQKVEEGAEFECEVSVKPKGKVPVTVEITDSKGSVQMETKYKVLVPKKIKKEFGIDCGKKIQILKPGKTIKCTKDGVKMVGKVNDDKEIDWKAE